MQGTCLCGNIHFEILGKAPSIYQCHCSLCRKVSGSTSSAAFFVPTESFTWLSGRDKITAFTRSSGYSAHFCSVCGSPVPNQFIESLYWVPAGLLTELIEGTVVAHLHVASRALWETMPVADISYDGAPVFDELVKLVCCKQG